MTEVLQPDTLPASTADWQKINNIFTIIGMMINGSVTVRDGYIQRGSGLYINSKWYTNTDDVAITGTTSEYVQINATTLVPTYISSLSGVTFDKSKNGWYDSSNNYYIFDELYAYGSLQTGRPTTIRNWRPRSSFVAELLSSNIISSVVKTVSGSKYLQTPYWGGIPAAGTFSFSEVISQSIPGMTRWVIPAGTYIMGSPFQTYFQIYNGSSWESVGQYPGGLIISNGVDFALYNDTAGSTNASLFRMNQ